MSTGEPDQAAGHPEQKKKEEAERSSTGDDDLDQALEDTFPASDPPAPAARGSTSAPRPREKDRDCP